MGGRVAVRGKVAAVTGAGSGIGRALVVELALTEATYAEKSRSRSTPNPLATTIPLLTLTPTL